MILESQQALVTEIGASHIELEQAVTFGFLNGSPYQELHGPEPVELRIGAAVLVGHCLFEANREDAGCGSAFIRRQANSHHIPHA